MPDRQVEICGCPACGSTTFHLVLHGTTPWLVCITCFNRGGGPARPPSDHARLPVDAPSLAGNPEALRPLSARGTLGTAQAPEQYARTFLAGLKKQREAS